MNGIKNFETKKEAYSLLNHKKIIELEKALEVKDEFLAYISHEFKTPLTVISAAIQAMEITCDEKSRGYLKKIRQNVYRQLRLINNLLDITKAQSGYINVHKRNMDIVFLTRLITESVALYAKEKGVELRFESDMQKKIIAIDDEKYERIILNLLSNAIKFTPSGKCINIRLIAKKNIVYVRVEDEGVGIPKEKQEMIFERFGQVDSNLARNSEGTGIGLTLVKLMTKALGGDIRVESEENIGTTFEIELPIETVNEVAEQNLDIAKDRRLIQAVNIEFSDIYLAK